VYGFIGLTLRIITKGQGIIFIGETGWYSWCGCQPTVGLVITEIKDNVFLCTNSQFLGGLMTIQVVDPLPLHRDFPVRDVQSSPPLPKKNDTEYLIIYLPTGQGNCDNLLCQVDAVDFCLLHLHQEPGE
jgi:hypothetical protein